MKAFRDKGRVSGILEYVPVYAVLEEDIGLRGAHVVAFRVSVLVGGGGGGGRAGSAGENGAGGGEGRGRGEGGEGLSSRFEARRSRFKPHYPKNVRPIYCVLAVGACAERVRVGHAPVSDGWSW